VALTTASITHDSDIDKLGSSCFTELEVYASHTLAEKYFKHSIFSLPIKRSLNFDLR